MLGHQRRSWINNPDSAAQQETSPDFPRRRNRAPCHFLFAVPGLAALCLLLLAACVALAVLYSEESVGRSEWQRLLLEYQNVSGSLLAVRTENGELRRDIGVLRQQSAQLQQQTERLNVTAARLRLQSGELREQLANLTSANLQLAQEQERLLQQEAQQEAQGLNMSQTITHLLDSARRREEERRRLAEANGLLRAQQQNLSGVLSRERREAAQREASSRNRTDRLLEDLQEAREAYSSLDRYCPEVSHRTKERMCRKCPRGWTLFQARCYFFSPRTLSWSSSRSWCRTQGADLLVVDSEAEQRFAVEQSQVLEPSSRLWIGLTDAEEEGHWSWVDGSALSPGVRFWLSRAGRRTEPDDWKQDDALGEDCGHIDTSEDPLQSWMDASCHKTYRWICEKEL